MSPKSISCYNYLQERRLELHSGFIGGNIDFWTDPHRRDSFGVLVIDILASSYVMADGHTLFMSNETKDKLDTDIFKTSTPKINNIEFPMSFERITWKMTSDAVSDQIFDSIGNAKIHASDFNQLSAD